MNRPGQRLTGQRRLLGDARRETTAAVHLAASKRRRLAQTDHPDPHEHDDDGNPTDTRALDDNDFAVFADAVYERDDAEADAIYDAVRHRMESRRQKQRDDVLHAQLKEYRDANPTIRQQFADLKSRLSHVSPDQWASIPDIGDYSVKKLKQQNFTPVPDSLLERARQETAYVQSDSRAAAATDLASVGAGRTSVLGQRLDSVGASLPGQTTVDADGYLTQLAGVKVSTDTEIGDIKKARLLLNSVTASNPRHAPGWVAAARLEETAGRMSDARKIILEGCRKCPRDDDVWVEAARIHPRETGRRILAQAVRNVPKSHKLWLQAAELEDDKSSKRRVLRKALEIIPRSEELWKTAVELEEPSAARILLSRAVEYVPSSTDLWQALARLESYDEAKEVLRRARKALPGVPAFWITEAQLEEVQNGASSEEIVALLKEGIKSLSVGSNAVERETWMEEAVKADKAGYVGTVNALVTSAIELGIADEDRESQWMSDASDMERKGCKAVARAVYEHLTSAFAHREDLWAAYADFEKRGEDRERRQQVLSEAVGQCPESVVLWLMLAKDKWKNGGGVEAAREVLRRAFEVNPNSEAVWLAAAKVETESGDDERARRLLESARKQAPSAKVYMKSALLERQLRRREAERQMLEAGLQAFEKAEKLWLMLAQWHERGVQENGDVQKTESANGETANGGTSESGGDGKNSVVHGLSTARAVYSRAVEKCSKSVHLWIGYARLEERCGARSKARAILERGRERCKGQREIDGLWRECVYLEVRDSKRAAGQAVLARGLQECRESGKLWALSVALEARAGQKSRSVDAIKACGQDACVLVEVGKYIWRSGKVAKARSWLQRAVDVDADWGDAWATLLAFERENGDEASAARVEAEAVAAEPKHGDLWTSVSKRIGNERLSCGEVLRRVEALVSKESDVTGSWAR